MSKSRPSLTAALTRRAAIAALALAFAAPAFAAGEDAAVAYMKKVAKDMLAAHRQGTVASFKRAIQRHADDLLREPMLGHKGGNMRVMVLDANPADALPG